jgi:hypothetical protein
MIASKAIRVVRKMRFVHCVTARERQPHVHHLLYDSGPFPKKKAMGKPPMALKVLRM